MKPPKSIDRQAIEYFWKLAKRHKRELILSCLMPLSAIGSGVIIPYYIGKILGSLATHGSQQWPYIIGMAIVCVLTGIINYVSFSNYFKLQPKIMALLQTEALEVLLKRSTGFHNSRVSGKLVSDVSDYASAGFMQLSNVFFIDIVPFLAIVVVGIVLVSIKSLVLGIVLTIMTSLAIGSSFFYRRKMKPFRARRQVAGKAVIAHTADTIVNNQTVKTFAGEAEELKRHQKLNHLLYTYRLQDWHTLATDGTQRLVGLFAFEIAFVIALTYEVHQNPALLATGIFAFSYTVTLSNRLFQISSMMRTVEEALLQVAPMTEILGEAVEITDSPKATRLLPQGGAVRFDEVAFHYSDSPADSAVFQHINIAIQAGEKVGIVGPSGGGKTTLTKLLLRFEDVTGGVISIDGQDIRTVTQESLRQAIAYVAQEPLLFHRSIRENIAYGKPSASNAAIELAADKAAATDFIQQLPNGYDTVVGERGIKLSGGQRQRIAIARAILKNAPILMLDEATSALDSASEKVIQRALWELMDGKTAIVIAHRLSTIQRLDRIIVLSNGSIAEEGSHSQLLKRNGLYASLWAHQSGGFIEE